MDPRDVPILVLGFNRPDFLSELFGELRQLRPRRIYFAVDGPRSGNPDDDEQVRLSREQVKSIDWPCEIRTRFNDSNLGCGLGVSSAISWFFENEELGVILEDDIRPDPSFFPFMAEMLTRYRDDDRVFAVTGTNFVPHQFISTPGAYRFSRIPVVWGWGTWRRVWSSYSFNIAGWHKGWSIREARQAMGGSWSAYVYWAGHFHLMANNRIDTWDYQVVCAAMRAQAVTVTPRVNLIENVGFDSRATHTQNSPHHLLERGAYSDGEDHDTPVRPDDIADRYHNEVIYGATPVGLWRTAKRGLKRRKKTGQI